MPLLIPSGMKSVSRKPKQVACEKGLLLQIWETGPKNGNFYFRIIGPQPFFLKILDQLVQLFRSLLSETEEPQVIPGPPRAARPWET